MKELDQMEKQEITDKPIGLTEWLKSNKRKYN